VRGKTARDQNYFTSLSALTSLVRGALSREEKNGCASDATIAAVKEILGSARVNRSEWSSFATFGSKYTRNVVAVDDRFVALLLCWAPRQASAIHDHAGSSCWVKILDGQLTEQLFPAGSSSLLPEASYMDDRRGVHRISNDSSEPAVSLHVYAPPFSSCNVYSPEEGGALRRARSVSMVAALAPDRAASSSLEEQVTLAEAGRQLETFDDDDLPTLLARLEPSAAEWSEFVVFNAERVARHLAHCDDHRAVVVSCFSPGQATPRYRWQAGRRAWHRVLHGDVRLAASSSSSSSLAFFVEEESRDGAHRLQNASSEDVAVLASVYSPPSLTLRSDDDETTLPVVSHASCSPLLAARHDAVHTNVAGLVTLLDKAFSSDEVDVEAVTAFMDNCVFDPGEWRGYDLEQSDSFARALVADGPRFNLFLTAWRRGNFSPVHDHDGSASWTRVLQGSLDEAVYDANLGLVRTGSLAANTTTYAGPSTVHGAANTNPTTCYTLTLYAPPYRHARAYYRRDDDGDGVPQTSSVRRLEIPTHVWGADGHADVSLLRPAAPRPADDDPADDDASSS